MKSLCAGEGTRTPKPLRALDPEPSVFANFTTPALVPRLYCTIIFNLVYFVNRKPVKYGSGRRAHFFDSYRYAECSG